MKLTWLVVADSSKARIFLTDSRTGPIKEIESIVHTEARLHEHDMTSDHPGRSKGNGGGGNVYQSKVSPKDQENINFVLLHCFNKITTSNILIKYIPIKGIYSFRIHSYLLTSR